MDDLRHQLTLDAGRSFAITRHWAFAAVWAALGCANADSQGSPNASPPVYADTVVPMQQALERFRTGLPDPGELGGGIGSRDELVRLFVDRLEHRDTAGLIELALTRAEFGYLYFPTAPEAAPPYELTPGLSWFMLQQNSRGGLLRALDERGGRPLGYLGYQCEGETTQGANTVWGPCLVRRLHTPRDTVLERLFGAILEHGGKYKFISLANKL